MPDLIKKPSKKVLLRRTKSKLDATFIELYPSLKNFPRNEHQGMAYQLKDLFTKTSSCLSMAATVPSKRLVYMQEAQGLLPTIKLWLRIARKEKCITPGFYRELDVRLSEVQYDLISAFTSR